MWEGLPTLLFLGLLMATASFLAGYLPLSLSLSSQQLRLITALGTGILVGTSLIIIIPEGVETLYSSSSSTDLHARTTPPLLMRSVSHLDPRMDGGNWLRQEAGDSVSYFTIATGEPHLGGDDALEDETIHALAGQSDTNEDQEQSPGHETNKPLEEEHADHGVHVWIGVSLILGFVLMYLIDTLPRTASMPSQPQRFHISLGQFSFSRPRSVSTDTTQEMRMSGDAAGSISHSRPMSTTLGLVIHAAADGIALGASSTSTTSNLSFIIFVAIMVHKAPAAFGLTTVLLKQGLSRRQARAHLIVFALAAPVGALVTWTAVHLLGLSTSSGGSAASNDFATGVLLLFSGGTFLYVAMHTMQDNDSGGHDHGTNGYTGVPMTDMYSGGPALSPPKPSGPALLDTFVTVVGMFLPLLAQWGDIH